MSSGGYIAGEHQRNCENILKQATGCARIGCRRERKSIFHRITPNVRTSKIGTHVPDITWHLNGTELEERGWEEVNGVEILRNRLDMC